MVENKAVETAQNATSTAAPQPPASLATAKVVELDPKSNTQVTSLQDKIKEIKERTARLKAQTEA